MRKMLYLTTTFWNNIECKKGCEYAASIDPLKKHHAFSSFSTSFTHCSCQEMHLSANSLGLFLVADVSISHVGKFCGFFSNRKKNHQKLPRSPRGWETFRRWATLEGLKLACQPLKACRTKLEMLVLLVVPLSWPEKKFPHHR